MIKMKNIITLAAVLLAANCGVFIQLEPSNESKAYLVLGVYLDML